MLRLPPAGVAAESVHHRGLNKALAETRVWYFWKERPTRQSTALPSLKGDFWTRLFLYLLLNITGIDWTPGKKQNMAESDWDTVTVLRKKGPTAAQAKSKQVSMDASHRLFFYVFLSITLGFTAT